MNERDIIGFMWDGKGGNALDPLGLRRNRTTYVTEEFFCFQLKS